MIRLKNEKLTFRNLPFNFIHILRVISNLFLVLIISRGQVAPVLNRIDNSISVFNNFLIVHRIQRLIEFSEVPFLKHYIVALPFNASFVGGVHGRVVIDAVFSCFWA